MNSYNSELRIEELNELLKKRDIPALKDSLRRTNPVDIEEFMSELDSEQSLIVYRLLRKDDAAEVFAELKRDGKHRLLTSITDPELDAIVTALSFDDVIDTLEEMPATVVKRILRNSDAETRKRVNQFLQFPEDSKGNRINNCPKYVHTNANRLRRKRRKPIINTCNPWNGNRRR